MRGLGIAAWSVFIADAALLAVIAALGLAAEGAVERQTMLGLAALGGIPLAALFAILGPSTLYRKRRGLWICLALGAVPLILLLITVVQQNLL
jgi:hypothetical protein